MYTVVDLFCGCGGGSMGFKAAGFTVVGAVENDQDAATAFHLNLGIPPIPKDICDVRGADILTAAGLARDDLTLLFGCPPCQSFTVLRRGSATSEADEKRNGLVYEYLRLVGELRPRHIAFENVPELAEGARWKPTFEAFKKKLKRLGYEFKDEVVDAAEYGVPQRRRRLLVIGSRVTQPILPARTHSQTGSDGLIPFVTVRDAIGRGRLRELDSGEKDPEDPFHYARRHTDLVLRRLAALKEGQGRADLPDELVLECHKGHKGHYDIYGRMRWDDVAPTLTSGCTNVSRGRFAHPDQNRAITLREAMLLQTFPENAVLTGGIEKASLQVGNAVPSRLAEVIGETIIKMEEASRKAEADTKLGRNSVRRSAKARGPSSGRLR